jgi:hypothetical protein
VPYVCTTTAYGYMLIDICLFGSCSLTMDFPSHWAKIPFSFFEYDVGNCLLCILWNGALSVDVTRFFERLGIMFMFIQLFVVLDSLHYDWPPWSTEVGSTVMRIKHTCLHCYDGLCLFFVSLNLTEQTIQTRMYSSYRCTFYLYMVCLVSFQMGFSMTLLQVWQNSSSSWR